jgi:dipeptidyl aminopeptidase/acylaminoacyl peptidase
VASATRDGADGLVAIAADGTCTPLDTGFTEVSQVVAAGDGRSALVVAAGATTEGAPYRVSLDGDGGGQGGEGNGAPVELDLLRPHRDLGLGAGWLSVPTHVSFGSAGGRTAHAMHYAPTNPEVTAPAGERPPLVVMIHGGPTSAARQRLDLAKQFWTSRGFAVVDVNYGGSTGYGRLYRRLLDDAWGIVDVEDAVAAAEHLAAEGLVDGDRLTIRGGSAGGFTTLAALCFHDTFAAGASHYGVADLAALAADTHKFESRYLDGLVGPWPEAEATYAERSPVRHTDGFDRPLIVLQGSEDEVVPPNQAEMIVDALAAKGVPHAYVLFDGEQHGFRQAANIVRALEAELWFYGRAFDFTPADDLDPVEGAVGL